MRINIFNRACLLVVSERSLKPFKAGSIPAQATKYKIMINLFKLKTNKLHFVYQYNYQGSYGPIEKTKKYKIEKILNKFKTNKNNDPKHTVFIKCEFNGYKFILFDLDDIENKNMFVKFFSNTPYALFQSSEDRHWVILESKMNYLKNTNWLSLCDPQFVEFSKKLKCFRIRGIYSSLKRKPILIKKNGDISKNFNLFLDKLTRYYNNEALELSTLKYKTPELLLKLNRLKKLKKLERVI